MPPSIDAPVSLEEVDHEDGDGETGERAIHVGVEALADRPPLDENDDVPEVLREGDVAADEHRVVL